MSPLKWRNALSSRRMHHHGLFDNKTNVAVRHWPPSKMEIHSLKWHRGNIKIWHIPSHCSCAGASPRSIRGRLLQGFQQSASGRETLSEGHVSPPWHSWVSRQTGRWSDTSLHNGPGGERKKEKKKNIYNLPNMPPPKLKSVTAPYKLTLRDWCLKQGGALVQWSPQSAHRKKVFGFGSRLS